MSRTLTTLLDDAAAATPDLDLVRGETRTCTYAQLAERSRRVAGGLAALGLRPGDRVAIAAPNGPEWLEFLFGAARLGLVVVTLNVRYRESELEYMLGRSGSRLLLSAPADGDADLRGLHRDLRPRVPAVEHLRYLGDGPDGFESLLGDPAAAPAHTPQPSDAAVLLYTSGTTGRPKGAVLTHGSILASARAQVARTGSRPGDVMLGVMPLNHVGGLTCTVTATMLAGGTVVMPPGYSPGGALRSLAADRVTVFAGVPTMWSLMLSHPDFPGTDTGSLRVAVIGGSNAEPALCEAISRGFPSARLSNLYGMTETSGAVVLSAPDDSLDTVAQTLGTPLDGVEIRVVDDAGEVVAPGADGELQVRGEQVADGYWQMPEETAATFLPGGWLATGDVVAVTPTGHLRLRGRRKEMFLQGGYNVYPVEIENVLTRHPAVAMAAGIGVPDPVLGEIGRYYVVPRDPAALDVDDLLGYCRAHLADYKVPRQVALVPELPTTPSGKVAKSVLREWAAGTAGQRTAGHRTGG
ncbi:long-chain fatty acid--CoA ligase [Pseudonocardia kongjuensis]|uniref:Long-chain fatty acid--CoA ligase n=1 Tax=Pseudonocardia kongjuensis TaxID=102227 RepID=A0ABP4IF18_9PSEU